MWLTVIDSESLFVVVTIATRPAAVVTRRLQVAISNGSAGRESP